MKNILRLLHCLIVYFTLAFNPVCTFAESNETNNVTENTQTPEIKDENITYNLEPQRTNEKPDSGVTYLVDAIMLLGTAIIAPGIMYKCTNTISAYIFSAGAAYYVFNEFKGLNDYKKKKESKEQMIINNIESFDDQLEKFEAAKSVSEDALKAVKDKMKNAEVYRGVLLAAATMAALEATVPYLKQTSDECSTGFVDRKKKRLYVERDINKLSIEKLHQFLSLLSENSYAAVGHGGATKTTALLEKTVAYYNKTIDKISKMGASRAIFFGVAAGLATVSINKYEKVVRGYEKNINNYKKIIDALNKNKTPPEIEEDNNLTISNVDNGLGVTPNSNSGFGGGPGGDSGGGNNNRVCTNCDTDKIPESLNYDPKLANIPVIDETLKSVSNGHRNMKAGDVAGATANFQKVANQAAKLKKIKRKAIDRLNQDRKKKGLRPISFEKAENEAFKKLKSALKKDLMNAPAGTRNSLLAALQGPESKEFENLEKEEKALKSALKFANSGNLKALKKMKPFDFGFGGSSSSTTPAEVLSSAKALEGLKIDSDIVKKPGVSIFKIITNRYFKSGYPKIFKRLDEKKK